MNQSNRPTSGNEITRRNFMKKSALTVGAISVLGQGIALAQISGNPLWWIDYEWEDADEVEVAGDRTDNIVEKINEAIEKRHNEGIGDAYHYERRPGGTEVDPLRYKGITASISGDNPKITYIDPEPPETQGKIKFEFKAGYKYRETHRE
jgi:hypothetical protein